MQAVVILKVVELILFADIIQTIFDSSGYDVTLQAHKHNIIIKDMIQR
jgi:hypothetical protein